MAPLPTVEANGSFGEVRFSGLAAELALRDTKVTLAPMQIRTFWVFATPKSSA